MICVKCNRVNAGFGEVVCLNCCLLAKDLNNRNEDDCDQNADTDIMDAEEDEDGDA